MLPKCYNVDAVKEGRSTQRSLSLKNSLNRCVKRSPRAKGLSVARMHDAIIVRSGATTVAKQWTAWDRASVPETRSQARQQVINGVNTLSMWGTASKGLAVLRLTVLLDEHRQTP